MAIEIMTDFDGGCSHTHDGIRRESERRFVVFPGIRRGEVMSEEVPGCGSRLSIRFRNTGRRTERVLIIADWHGPDRTEHHDLGYCRHQRDREWRMSPGLREGGRVEYHLALRPGLTELGLYPEYSYGQCRRFVGRLKRKGVAVEVAGKSREGRDVWLLSFRSQNPKASRFFLQTRDQAYETAGSYGSEGVGQFLLCASDQATYLRSKFHVFIVPMTNPDGVFNGMSRLTWEQGADMNRVHTVSDPAHDALRGAIDCVRPDAHMNVHNWTDKFMDGLLANDQSIADKILRYMPADHAHYKYWHVQTTADFCRSKGVAETPEADKSWKNYCKEHFDSVGVNFEFPWFSLSTEGMRAKGARAFVSLALAAIEERKP